VRGNTKIVNVNGIEARTTATAHCRDLKQQLWENKLTCSPVRTGPARPGGRAGKASELDHPRHLRPAPGPRKQRAAQPPATEVSLNAPATAANNRQPPTTHVPPPQTTDSRQPHTCHRRKQPTAADHTLATAANNRQPPTTHLPPPQTTDSRRHTRRGSTWHQPATNDRRHTRRGSAYRKAAKWAEAHAETARGCMKGTHAATQANLEESRSRDSDEVG
jgi:hypothetical protein